MAATNVNRRLAKALALNEQPIHSIVYGGSTDVIFRGDDAIVTFTRTSDGPFLNIVIGEHAVTLPMNKIAILRGPPGKNTGVDDLIFVTWSGLNNAERPRHANEKFYIGHPFCAIIIDQFFRLFVLNRRNQATDAYWKTVDMRSP